MYKWVQSKKGPYHQFPPLRGEESQLLVSYGFPDIIVMHSLNAYYVRHCSRYF